MCLRVVRAGLLAAGLALDETEVSSGRDDEEATKPTRSQQRAVLMLGAFTSARNDEHGDVNPLAHGRLVGGRDDTFDQQEGGPGYHPVTAGLGFDGGGT